MANDQSISTLISVDPNPVRSYVNITSRRSSIVEVHIYDPNGHMVTATKSTDNRHAFVLTSISFPRERTFEVSLDTRQTIMKKIVLDFY